MAAARSGNGCNVCHREFPRTAEFWNKQPRNRDGLDGTCKSCATQHTKAWYAANRERRLAQSRENYAQNREQMLAASARYREANLEKRRAADRAWKAANREKHRAGSNRYRLANAEHVAAKKHADYLADPELAKQRAKEWVKANRERSRAGQERRRAIRKGAPGVFTKDDLIKQHQTQEGKCFYCSVDMLNEWTVDHYIPLSKGGTNFADNIVLACGPCNNSKRAKLPAHFKPKSASI